jgi:hypothetical protein
MIFATHWSKGKMIEDLKVGEKTHTAHFDSSQKIGDRPNSCAFKDK